MADLDNIRNYFQGCFEKNGESATGVDWNSPYAQETRFDQLLRVINPEKPFSILDFGCGYGHLAEYLRKKGLNFTHYYGYDIVPEELEAGEKKYAGDTSVSFHSSLDEIPTADYLTASGVFNICLNNDHATWTKHILDSLNVFNQKASRGFASNFLTSYSDADRMAERPDLYFADPCMLFDYCRRHFSRNVALLHDYKIWDFTILVRKEND